MEGLTVISNFHKREVIDAWSLSAEERKEFDYLDWKAIEEGSDSASFVRYKGDLIDLGEFMYLDPTRLQLAQEIYFTGSRKWDGYQSDSFFSGLLVSYCKEDNWETVIMGRYYS
jgi:hypothetical protein